MSDARALIFEIIAGAELFSGLLVNAFISAVNLHDWWINRKLKPYDKIVVHLGFCRIFLSFCVLFRILNRLFELNAYLGSAQRCVFRVFQLALDYASLWFGMWLCTLYYIKIVIFKCRLLVWVKLSIPQLVLPIVFTTYVLSLFFGFLFSYVIRETSDVMDAVYLPVNKSVDGNLSYMIPSYFFGHFLPFILVSISTSLLIHAICHHIRHIKNNSNSFKSPRLDAHLAAIRSAVLLQLVTTLNLVATIFFRFDFYGQFETNMSFLFIASFPTLHSMVVIACNSKLKRALWRALPCLKGHVTVEKSSASQQTESKRETVRKQK
ncbi:taste receptor type 2 member 39-like [Hyperolius riggenbachi]|uniref:taste receptor type 2 member 39-like n=1 Tax=Hyperolius riggenbachi TaxID=752182 RepID=UPI0035A2A0D3